MESKPPLAPQPPDPLKPALTAIKKTRIGVKKQEPRGAERAPYGSKS